MQLRPYQIKAIDEIRNEYSKGNKKLLLHLATGAGKTVIFSYILKALSEKGKKAAMIVRGRQLVDQASRRLQRENVRHGVRMANHWRKDYQAPVQICSVDTLVSRGKNYWPEADLIVIDEAHMATSDGYREILDHYNDKYILGVTATPWVKNGLGHLAEKIIHPISMIELIKQGYLVPPRYFAPSEPDLKGVATSNGDFVAQQLQERMGRLTGDIVSTWKKFGENRPTILFAVNIEHSMSLTDSFNKAGVSCEHLEADHSFEERESAIKRLESGETKILSNVGILCTGVDIPLVSCLIMARPTKSYNLFIQQAGRGTRIFENKKDFLLLDHGGNVLRHGFVTDEPEASLHKNEEIKIKRCNICFMVYQSLWCPDCGPQRHDVDRSTKEIMQVEGELKEIFGLDETIKISIRFAQLKRQAKEKGYKRGWIFHQMVREFSSEVANKIMPKRVIPPWVRLKNTTN